MFHETYQRKEDRLPGRGFDDSGFAYSSGVEIDVGTFFSGFLLNV